MVRSQGRCSEVVIIRGGGGGGVKVLGSGGGNVNRSLGTLGSSGKMFHRTRAVATHLKELVAWLRPDVFFIHYWPFFTLRTFSCRTEKEFKKNVYVNILTAIKVRPWGECIPPW